MAVFACTFVNMGWPGDSECDDMFHVVLAIKRLVILSFKLRSALFLVLEFVLLCLNNDSTNAQVIGCLLHNLNTTQ